MIRIHNFARGARGLRVMWLCEEMGLPYERVVVTYPPSAEYLALHSLGTVPFLEDGDTAISESVAMVLYVAEKYGPTPLLPAKDDPAFGLVLQLTVVSEASIGAGVNTLLAEKFGAPEADKRNWSARGVEATVRKHIDFVAHKLGSKDYLAGAQLTIADVCISTALGVWRGAVGHGLPDTLSAYQDRIAARPAYQRARAVASAL